MVSTLVLGSAGLVGRAFIRNQNHYPEHDFIGADRAMCDLLSSEAVDRLFQKVTPERVILAAARVGGIGANMLGGSSFFYDNVDIQRNVIRSCLEHGVRDLVLLGSTCIYPTGVHTPIQESQFMTGPLERTNEGYALAKIAGIYDALLQHNKGHLRAFLPMPCNLYGPNDHFDRQRAHVLGALTKVFADAVSNNNETVTVWGSGAPRREFLHVDDLVSAIMQMLDANLSGEIINVGSEFEVSIQDLARKVAEACGFHGEVIWDSSMPDGVMSKLVDSSRMRALGWRPAITLDDGIQQLVEHYRANPG